MDFIPKIRMRIWEPSPINWEDPPHVEVCNSYYLTLLLLPLHIADLIIGEAADPPPLDRPFCRFTLRRRCPEDQTNKTGSYNWRRLWELKQKSLVDDWQELGSDDYPVAFRHLELGRSPIPHLILPRQSQCHATL